MIDRTYDDDHDDESDTCHDDGHAQNLRIIAGFRQVDRNPDLLEAWVQFGEHNWLWQMFHRKPGRAS